MKTFPFFQPRKTPPASITHQSTSKMNYNISAISVRSGGRTTQWPNNLVIVPDVMIWARQPYLSTGAAPTMPGRAARRAPPHGGQDRARNPDLHTRPWATSAGRPITA